MSVFMGEIVGTALLMLFGCGVVAGVLLTRSKANGSGWIVITVGWALAVLIGVYAAAKASGAHLNPAVTIGLAVIGKTPWDQVPAYIAGQFIGAMIGAAGVWLAYLPHWKETADPGLKLAVFSTGPAIRNPVSNFISEFIGTFLLVFVIIVIGANKYADGVGPIAVALLILAIGVSFGGPTGYAINPARDLGPRIRHAILPIEGKGDSDWSYAWIPVVGPIAGGICAALLGAALYP